MRVALEDIYRRLLRHFGPTHWWPGDTPFEIAIGAILTQNTAWSNVERAIANLKRERLLRPRAMLACPRDRLEAAIRPSGYFRQKAERLRIFCDYLTTRYGGSMRRMARRPVEVLREELLAIKGIGPETADDILLYACEKPVFVVDAYTRRILSRHGLVSPKTGYEELRAVFETNLPPEVALFKEYHGLIVYVGKDFCRKTPRCEGCPLAPILPQGGPPL
ncbi:MAG TPA: endonuclease III domain-containing protein [Candidatus Hydrogenedentes bacterium]|nr:endonuclease III domain-containing protein [Candidatus Hydrogenedentota bacterium]HNT87306.1 endonuclease III domain-containing protein [Candidatus Hydrogenedentota bacterium]